MRFLPLFYYYKIGGDAPCAPIYSVKVSGLRGWWWTNVRARRWRRWYDQVIPLSELSAARGYLQSVFFFFFFSFSRRPHLASRVTPSRSHRNEYTGGNLWPALVWRTERDFSFLTQRQLLDTDTFVPRLCLKMHYSNCSVVYLFFVL